MSDSWKIGRGPDEGAELSDLDDDELRDLERAIRPFADFEFEDLCLECGRLISVARSLLADGRDSCGCSRNRRSWSK